MHTRFSALLGLGAVSLLALSAPAYAGEDVIYAAAPAWVEPYELDKTLIADGPSALLYDWQHRLDGGTVTSYEDAAIRIDNPDTLTEEGTVTLTWMPDKGDLTVHRVAILRGDETIDVLKDGATFDVLRREEGLENRLIDGELTATMAVPGLEVGDILHVTHSTTLRDQALGDAMQVTQYLPPKPWQVGFSRAIVSWPKDAAIYWRAEDSVPLGEPEVAGGYKRLEVTLPLAKPGETPADAPSRFGRDAILRVGTFASWQDLSSLLAPHYAQAAALADGGAASNEVADIMRATDKPLERAAAALRLVQDDVSYLLNGLDGGNYLPQSAEETWAKRYGDCKAKSVLLTAMLGEMGIEADPVLVVTAGGDALPELLPLPGDFDHMIVRARIDGVDYWLDGTSTGTRITNIGEVPGFFHALPLTAAGSDLVPVTQREQPFPDMVMKLTADYSAGIDLPYLFELDMKLYGPQGASIQALADADDPAQLRAVAASITSESEGAGAVSSVTVGYDDDAAAGSVRIRGVTNTDFTWDDGRLVADASTKGNDIGFDADRARPEWRNIPVQTPGPMRNRFEVVTILPGEAGAFAYEGDPAVDAKFANTRIVGNSVVEGNRHIAHGEVIQGLGEIAAAEVPEVKRALNLITSKTARLVAPEDVIWRWELEPAELRRRAAPIVAAYTAAIDFAEEDDFAPLAARAAFRTDIFDWKNALADYDTLVAEQTSVGNYFQRAAVLFALGRGDDAIADIEAAYELQPDNGTAFYLARQLAYAGRQDEALALLEALPVGEDDSISYADAFATVSGLGGDTQTGIDLLAKEVADKPNNASLLNSDCWFRGLFSVALDTAVERCTRAVERAENSAPVLDSRAMVLYRLGKYDEAIADLDAALAVAPGLAASRYLRGIIKLEKGQDGGRDDVEMALRIAPQIAERYARHGIKPLK